MKKQHIDFKDGVNNLDLLFISPFLMLVLADISLYCHVNNKEFKVTSIIRTTAQDKKLGAVSSTHRDGRAFDMSLIGFTEKQISQLKNTIEYKYGHLGAISKNTKKENLFYIHNNGHGNHAHIQVRK